MRLRKIEKGDSLNNRLFFGMIRLLSGSRAPDVIRTLRYHRDFFGAPHTAHTQAVMRDPSAWSVGERELFAAFVSWMNQCFF